MKLENAMNDLKPYFEKQGISIVTQTWGELREKYPRFSTINNRIDEITNGDPDPDEELIPLPSTAIEVLQKIETASTPDELEEFVNEFVVGMMEVTLFHKREIEKIPDYEVETFRDYMKDYYDNEIVSVIKQVVKEVA